MVEAGKWGAQGSGDYADWTALAAEMTAGIVCYIASVTDSVREQQLAARLEAAGIQSTWLLAEAGFGEVTNTYLNPQQLGVDRWLGLIAARQRTRAPVLVVSAGTAMTVDALSAEGVFLGGVIVPGASLMRQSLQQGTARVNDATGDWQAFPRSTADGVQSGIIAAMCGAIQLQHARLAEVAGTPPHCLLTGGDAGMLLPHLSVSAEVVPALVLEGIDCVARERDMR
jgi:type III pantothenate kinase